MSSMLQLTDEPDIPANDLLMAKNMADILHRKYPGHLWAVSINGGMADVRNMALAGDRGFRLRIPTIYSASEWDKRVMNAGGELLERYRVRRTGGAEEAFNLPVDFAGRPRYDQ